MSSPNPIALRDISLCREGKTELIVGLCLPGEVRCDVTLLDPSETLEDHFGTLESAALLFWGDWPTESPDDGDVITLELVDRNGVLRHYPH